MNCDLHDFNIYLEIVFSAKAKFGSQDPTLNHGSKFRLSEETHARSGFPQVQITLGNRVAR